MFGYIRPCYAQLRVCELETYRGVYCGLCHCLGRTFGPLARFALSYDGALLAMLAMAFQERQPDFALRRCPFNPLHRKYCCVSESALQFAGDIWALTLYHKLRDNLADDGLPGRLAAGAGLKLAERAYLSAKENQPGLARVISEQMEAQRILEEERCPSVDRAAEPSARCLEAVFAVLDPAQGRILSRMGYLLGRYIYLADALDDLEEDSVSGGYNPLLLRAQESGSTSLEEIRRDGLGSLYLTIAELGTAYTLLEVRRFEPIFENIFGLGLRGVADSLTVPKKERKKLERSALTIRI